MAQAALDRDAHAPHRRWLARPRTFGKPLLWSLGVHSIVAVMVVLLWVLYLKPPPKPIRISTVKNAPTRESLGLDVSGHPTWLDSASSSSSPPPPARD